MTISIARDDCTSEELHRLAGMCKDVRQSRRFRALAMVLDGVSRSEVASAQGTTVQSIRDWILRFDAHGPDGLVDGPRTGRPCRLSEAERREVALWIEEGPDAEEDGVSRWRLIDIRDKVLLRFNEYFSLEGIRRVIRSLGFVNISPRPVHPKADPVKQEEFRRDFSELAMHVVPDGTEPVMIDVWFQDEARAGQKGMLSRVWALGAQGKPPPYRPGSPLRLRISLRGGLSRAFGRGRPHLRPRQYRRDESPSCRYLRGRADRSPCRAGTGRCWMAPFKRPRNPGKHFAAALAALQSRTQSHGERIRISEG